MTECGKGREGPLLATQVGIGEKAGETGDKERPPRYLVEGQLGRDKVVKLKGGDGRGIKAAMERHLRQESPRL